MHLNYIFITQVLFHIGLRSFPSLHKDFDDCTVEGRTAWGLSFESHKLSFKTHAVKSLTSYVTETSEQATQVAAKNLYSSPQGVSHSWRSLIKEESGSSVLRYIDNSSTTTSEGGLMDFTDQSDATVNVLPAPVEIENMAGTNIMPEDSGSVSDTLNTGNESLSDVKENVEDFISSLNESVNSSVNEGGNAIKNSLDTIKSSITSLSERINEAVDNTINGMFTTVDKSGEIAGSRLSKFSSILKDTTSKATVVAVDALRYTIVTVEKSLASGASYVVYSYGLAKEMLDPEFRDAVNASEETAKKFLAPAVTALQQVF